MLKHLYIKNYALIEELDMDFQEGFSVITGETGAGKSILLGAIGLLLGQRADSKSIQTGAGRCVIEAEFYLEGFGLETFFSENDFDFEGHTCTLRRELTSAGKSRAFINDTPATVAQLKELGSHIIDIHSQHQNLLLANENFQMEILDILGNNEERIKQYSTIYQEYKTLEHALEKLKERINSDKENEDYLRFQLKQLSEFNPIAGEDETLQEEAETLSHAEDIKSALFQATERMSGEQYGIVSSLRQVLQTLQSATRHYPAAEEWCARVEEAYIDLKDLSQELEEKAESITFDPQRLEAINNRLDELYTLEKKHHTDSAEGLVRIKEQLAQQIGEMDCSEEDIAEKEKELAQVKKNLVEKAGELTQSRSEAATLLQEKMHSMLAPLGMPNAHLDVQVAPLETPSAKGMDQVVFFFSANKNGTPRPIADVASGGEVARVMLSLKTLISKAKQLPTIIFDEIDTGVSGNIADCMAQMMKEMASNHKMQVISITHLPQIAAMGGTHYRVYKEDTSDQTLSHIKQLDKEERIKEIANMLSGAQVSQAAIENAKQLLNL
ncbi:MAG: DNA repair protein RecN [Bacteroidaceae bacterium]|nr:DNA repair protein RecN [Bacteroidaceae bacterium]